MLRLASFQRTWTDDYKPLYCLDVTGALKPLRAALQPKYGNFGVAIKPEMGLIAEPNF